MQFNILKVGKRRWMITILFVFGLIMIVYGHDQLLSIISIISDRDGIIVFLGKYGPLGPVILSIILGLQVFLAFIPGHAFIVAGGYIYGLVIGTLITQISTVIASQLAFMLTRRYGRSLVDRVAPTSVIDQWNKLAEKQGGLFFFFSFILPIFPNDLMCFIAGLSVISPKKFFLANFFGRLPVALFVTLIGSHGFEIPLYFWALMVILLIILTFCWKCISIQIERRFFKDVSSTKCLC